jgi:lipoprotein-anchoring transpeptidase ErfK/SrfK
MGHGAVSRWRFKPSFFSRQGCDFLALDQHPGIATVRLLQRPGGLGDKIAKAAHKQFVIIMKFNDMTTPVATSTPAKSTKTDMSRRALMLGLPLFAAGCGISPDGFMFSGGDYGGISDDGNVIPPLDFGVIDRDKLRRQVAWSGREKPGSVVVKIPERHLYLVMDGGRALRYSVGVGRAAVRRPSAARKNGRTGRRPPT